VIGVASMLDLQASRLSMQLVGAYGSLAQLHNVVDVCEVGTNNACDWLVLPFTVFKHRLNYERILVNASSVVHRTNTDLLQ
jgi:hypothetical protein